MSLNMPSLNTASLDTPATIAIVGSGPVGLEAALYARFLGYTVNLYERGKVAEHVRNCGELPWPATFQESCSSLGLAALLAQEPGWQPPRADAKLTAAEYLQFYLLPLSETDLLVDWIQTESEIVQIECVPVSEDATAMIDELENDEDNIDDDDDDTDSEDDAEVDEEDAPRRAIKFRLTIRNSTGEVRTATSDAVLDCTGTHGSPSAIRFVPKAGVENEVAPDNGQSSPTDLMLVAPFYFVLGESRPDDPLIVSLNQICRLFAIFGGRENLNLYATIAMQ